MAIANWTCVSWVAYAPGTIAVNIKWIEREFNACQTPRSMYPSIFNHFWDIVVYRWRVSDFQQYSWANELSLTTFCFPLGTPLGQSRQMLHVSKENSMLVKRMQHVPIYLQPFMKYSSGGSRERGWVAPIDLTNFCINVKSHLRMHQNTHHFLVKLQFFSGEGAQPTPKTPPLDCPPPL